MTAYARLPTPEHVLLSYSWHGHAAAPVTQACHASNARRVMTLPECKRDLCSMQMLSSTRACLHAGTSVLQARLSEAIWKAMRVYGDVGFQFTILC